MPYGLRSRGGGAWLALLMAAGALAACATGHTGPLASATPLEREFALAAVTWDLNKDGEVTCDEWKQYVAGLFRDADANRDGFLTRQEFAALARDDRLFEVAGFDYFDANADDRLSLSEMADKPNPAFQLLDKNGDCVISAEERVNQRSYARDDGKSQGATSPSGRRK
jgi:hypothetical protein